MVRGSTVARRARTPDAVLPLGADVVALLQELAHDARAALDIDPEPLPATVTSRTALRLLDELWDAAFAASGRTTGAGPGRRDPALELLHRIRQAESAVTDARMAGGLDSLDRISVVLASVRDAASTDDFFDRVPEAVCGLGYDRVLVSRVEDATWKLHRMCVTRDPRWAEDIVEAGRSRPPRLDGRLVETDAARHVRPCLVLDAQNNRRVDRNIVRVGRSRSYTIAPLLRHGDVVGLLHADRYYQGTDVSSLDQALLGVTAQGLSQILGRVATLDGLAALQAGVERLMAPPGLPPGRPVVPAATAAPGRPPVVPGSLTDREADVMELLVAGYSNRIIAQALSIGEGTVKTHVTHILRKLGVASRAEAIALHLRPPH
ncbi:LuxR family transcriptional regulator [Pseudonocardia sp. C8]|uniref:helix-turn-helix transcriptional regulator n=1 Tax=Pseudonocardia sp. C8 TaxID=2762759 RepID=UPI0016424773|nr:LuxR C-terminal-related transcriptional regulator [Pseudonocardia sp. C8]MBC3191711.1 LuxR family transcriptional regulator [Pseudonocardia sp. C8]